MEGTQIDQSAVAKSVSDKIKFEPLDCFLVKPLDPVKVKKEFTKPIPTKKDNSVENDNDIQDYDKVEKEIKEVDSDYRSGVVIKMPLRAIYSEDDPAAIKIGSIIVFRDTAGMYFDLVKDTKLIRSYDIVGIEKQ